ncbi:MAG: hypothetical protein V1716_02395 [Candidatus Uhrbacteria bacterium]
MQKIHKLGTLAAERYRLPQEVSRQITANVDATLIPQAITLAAKTTTISANEALITNCACAELIL